MVQIPWGCGDVCHLLHKWDLTSSILNPPNAPHFTVKSQYPSFQGPTSIDKSALAHTHLSVLTPPHLPLAHLPQPCWPPHHPSILQSLYHKTLHWLDLLSSILFLQLLMWVTPSSPSKFCLEITFSALLPYNPHLELILSSLITPFTLLLSYLPQTIASDIQFIFYFSLWLFSVSSLLSSLKAGNKIVHFVTDVSQAPKKDIVHIRC